MWWPHLRTEIAREFFEYMGGDWDRRMEAFEDFARFRKDKADVGPNPCQWPGCWNPKARTGGARYCQVHAARAPKEWTRGQYRKMKALGLCGACQKRPASKGHAHCESCLQRIREDSIAFNARRGIVNDGRACAVCRQKGHNRRSCPQATPEQRRRPAPKTRREVPSRCSKCRKSGHNRRGCPA